MQVREIMTRDVETASPRHSIGDAARRMDELNVGALPVCDGQRLVGLPILGASGSVARYAIDLFRKTDAA